MATTPEQAPTEPQPTFRSGPPPGRSRGGGSIGGAIVDRLYRLAIVVIAAVLVLFLILYLAGVPLHVKLDRDGKGKHGGGLGGGGGGGKPRVTKSAGG